MNVPAAPQRREVNWSTLLPDVLTVILCSLTPQECLAVRGVCTSWRAVAKKQRCRVADLPMRLMVRRPAPDERTAVIGFLSTSGQRLLDIEVSDAALGKFRCCGHHDGWLALVSDEGYEMLLLNPVTNARVRLPTCNHFSSNCTPGSKFGGRLVVGVKKVILSAAPSTKECIVAVVGRCSYVALCRPEHGDNWITLDAGGGAVIEDAIFAQDGKLFVLVTDGSLRIFDLRSYPRAAAVSVVAPGEQLAKPTDFVIRRYLVESSGEVMAVFRRYSGYYTGAVTAFRVFKLQRGPSASWIPVTDLGDRTLFVSTNWSESITAADSKDANLKKNCIYFTKKAHSFPTQGDVGVFSMASMTSTWPISISGEYLQGHEAVWVRPSL